MSNRIVHFEIHADDVERAIKFYSHVFGWEFPKFMDNPPYWGIVTAPKDSHEPGINGGLLPRKGHAPKGNECVTSYVCTIQVDSYDKIHDKIIEARGTIALPKFAIPGMAWQGYYRDTEGNIFGIHEPDEKAK